MFKRIAILGSTGSIGQSTLEVARHLRDHIDVVAIAAHSNIDLLENQAREFQPEIIAVGDKDQALELKRRLPEFTIVGGNEGIIAAATHDTADIVVSAIVGAAGLAPTISAIDSGKDIALANKEVLVAAGSLVTEMARRKGVKLLPVDSEHSAIFQCLHGEGNNAISRLILTSSGGPFRGYSTDKLKSVTLKDALKHPTWKMGAKITVDSSTLMNKGLEVIEAHWLFDVPISNIEVVVHPQSIVHSMVEFVDRSILAQMSNPDMMLPIQYALMFPNRLDGILEPLDFKKTYSLEFSPPDMKTFTCLRLAYEAINYGGSLPCYMNAANEVLVSRFLNKEIPWHAISSNLEKLMSKHIIEHELSLEKITAIDTMAREEAKRI